MSLLSNHLHLLQKYDQAGPRYTSYPTAPYFHEKVKEAEYLKLLEMESTQTTPFSLYVHIPFCDTLCYFCGCNMMVTQNREKISTYLNYLKKELTLSKNKLNPKRPLKQLHWGGGSPTHLQPDQIRQLGGWILEAFPLSPDPEMSIEIDPRELTRDHLVALREVGFKRCSIGIQDFNPKVQKAINRVQSKKITQQVVEWARELGFESLNLDLMYGLPHQTQNSFQKTLEEVLHLKPDRLAVSNYAHLPQLIKQQKMIQEEWLPSPDTKIQLLQYS
ncbi:MAG: oxygen-independent coproporphyrinogen III oxidase, partial [Simkania sp.]|nr:oxygen-independent coproporphyrinogen III oxidase [Simkania sp.]